ncbi:Sec7-domain-containing protein [Coccomyxa subellipsoidea C-169]|uniref:Sec7-domain-containing protein n=1 Tax=Coccomyxa subellipsoidea (strain C-169) TaxID=574566 RepID=I0YJ87_COCSC|nr:Sec7-domain-containing protein [Coccomyxa subellipsoidea C-169]EIE18456.1 Sec7-domain-containing protein [Coccomyxa subellipsoidea C-169]|eukprot:XP_005643000.1 Sec7-domain-containing protein [Coccomyxa subellipsoidea C-169]
MTSETSSPMSSRRGSADSLHRVTPMPGSLWPKIRSNSGRMPSLSESEDVRETVFEEAEEQSGETEAQATNSAAPQGNGAAPGSAGSGAGSASPGGRGETPGEWEASPRDMRELDAAAIAERLGNYNRTSSTEMLARMKQDAAAAPSQRGASPFEAVPPLSGGGPASARRLDSAADDATPRSGGMHARKASQLGLGEVLDPVSKDEEADDVAVARFLRTCPGLSKAIIGDLLGQNTERCLRVLDAFTHMFDFSGMSFEAAIREFLESFRLPGEAQKIIRILEQWSRQFYAQEPGIFASADAVYILAISVIMLNTDKHNPAIKKKMTREEFIRNNRGINGTKDAPADLPNEFLTELYTHFSERAIRFPQLPSSMSDKYSSPPSNHTIAKAHKAAKENSRWNPLRWICCQ